MMIIGCDLHTRYQQIAMVDTETGEFVQRRLEHESGEARGGWPTQARVLLLPSPHSTPSLRSVAQGRLRLFTTDASRRTFESGWNIPP